MAPGSSPDDPVRGLVPCFIPPRMLQSGAFFCRILSVASDAPVRGTGFTPGRSSPGARAELHAAPDAPIRGVMYLSLFAVFSVRLFCSRQGFGTLPGAHTSIRTAAVALWGLRGLDLFLAACSLSGVGVCRGGVVFCAVVRARVWCCVCALPGLRVARAPCPGVLLRRRGDTLSLWRARLAPWRALLAPGCGPARGSGVCVRWGGGGLGPLPSPSAPCPSVPFRRPALPAYPLPTRWVGLGWTVGLGGLTWCFFPAGRRGLGSFWGRVARVVCRAPCTVSWASWLLFTGVYALCVVLRVRCPGPLGSCSPVCVLCVWCCVYGVQGLLTPVHRRARPVCGVACTVSWASWLLFTGVRALCVVLCARCPGSLGSCSPVCAFCVWCCVYGVLGLLDPVHRCARSMCGVVCTVSWAYWLLFTGVHALCVVLRVRRPGPLGSCSPLCSLCVWCCVYGVLGLLAPVHRCARSVCGVACTVSWASWLLFTGVHVLCVVLRVRCPGPPGSCSPVCTPCVWCYGCGVLGRLAPVHRRARSPCGVVCAVSWVARLLCTGVPALVCCVLCTVSWASLLRFTGVHTLCAVSCAWSPGPFGPFLLVCSCGVCCVACVVSWDTWFVFSGVAVCCGVCRVRCAVLPVRCPGPPGPCSPVRTPGVWCCVGGVLGRLAPVHRCACAVCCVVCLVSWASWLPVTGVPVLCVAWCVRCRGPLGSRSPVCPCGVCCVACSVSWASWLLFTGVLCACSVCCVLCAVSPATWVLFTGVLARCVAWCVRCGCGCVLACAIPSSLHFLSRPRVGAVGVFMAQTPWGTPQRTRHWHSRCPASYGVLLILPVGDSLFLGTPKSKRVLMHAWRCMLFTRWFVYSLYFATPKSRRVCLLHS